MGCPLMRHILLILITAVIIVGVVCMFEGVQLFRNEMLKLIISGYWIRGICVLLLGAIIMGFSILGIIGVISNNIFILTLYAIFLLIHITFNIVFGIHVAADVKLESEMRRYLETSLQNLFEDYTNNYLDYCINAPLCVFMVDEIQSQWKCCGLNQTSYWKSIPKSCCKNLDQAICTSDAAFEKGCLDVGLSKLKYLYSAVQYCALLMTPHLFIILTLILFHTYSRCKRTFRGK